MRIKNDDYSRKLYFQSGYITYGRRNHTCTKNSVFVWRPMLFHSTEDVQGVEQLRTGSVKKRWRSAEPGFCISSGMGMGNRLNRPTGIIYYVHLSLLKKKTMRIIPNKEIARVRFKVFLQMVSNISNSEGIAKFQLWLAGPSVTTTRPISSLFPDVCLMKHWSNYEERLAIDWASLRNVNVKWEQKTKKYLALFFPCNIPPVFDMNIPQYVSFLLTYSDAPRSERGLVDKIKNFCPDPLKKPHYFGPGNVV